MVGWEDPPPANVAAISGGIAPEVAEIAGAGEIEVAGRRIWHGVSLSRALRRRNDGESVSLALVYMGLPRGRTGIGTTTLLSSARHYSPRELQPPHRRRSRRRSRTIAAPTAPNSSWDFSNMTNAPICRSMEGR